MTAPALHRTSLGQQGTPVVFCHGLFGQGKNWTQVAKQISATHRVTLLDLPNHGRSPWSESHDYVDAAEQVAATLADVGEPVALVGHSMGGKIAMLVALLHPYLVERLCVVDVSPVSYTHHDEFRRFMDAMLDMDLDALTSRDDADAMLQAAVPNASVRSFLLQNLRRESTGWRWLPNLKVLRRDVSTISAWPDDAARGRTYDGPVLWVAGAESDYVRPEYAAAMDSLFPLNRLVRIKAAGHWVHSEQPTVFTEVLRRFLEANDS